MRRTIYEQRRSPYLELLKHVGCEYGDLESLVGQNGVEGALKALRREGVYLASDEFKGRKRVIRRNLILDVTPHKLRNPLVSPQVRTGSSGSTGREVVVYRSMPYIRDTGLIEGWVLAARDGLDWSMAHRTKDP
jgi:hypothetical protein